VKSIHRRLCIFHIDRTRCSAGFVKPALGRSLVLSHGLELAMTVPDFAIASASNLFYSRLPNRRILLVRNPQETAPLRRVVGNIERHTPIVTMNAERAELMLGCRFYPAQDVAARDHPHLAFESSELEASSFARNTRPWLLTKPHAESDPSFGKLTG
jgi:hypothetical protein